MSGGRGYGPEQWDRASFDPSAGVRLAPSVIRCPRCGIEKRGGTSARKGLCRDCSDVLGAERVAWAV